MPATQHQEPDKMNLGLFNAGRVRLQTSWKTRVAATQVAINLARCTAYYQPAVRSRVFTKYLC